MRSCKREAGNISKKKEGRGLAKPKGDQHNHFVILNSHVNENVLERTVEEEPSDQNYSKSSAIYSQKVGGNRKDVFYNGERRQGMVECPGLSQAGNSNSMKENQG